MIDPATSCEPLVQYLVWLRILRGRQLRICDFNIWLLFGEWVIHGLASWQL